MDNSDNQLIKPDRLLTTLELLLGIDSTELEPALQRATDIVAEVLAADKVDVFLYEPESESLVARGTSDTPMGRKQREIGMHRLPLAGYGRAVEVFQSGVPHLSGRVDEDPNELIGLKEGLGARSQVIVPLNPAGEPRGVLVVVSAGHDFFSEEDQAFLEAVGRWTGLVMHRTELAKDLLNQAEERGRRVGLQSMLAHLTPRQLEVAILIAQGHTNEQIAHKLVLTSGTVANHVAQTLDRLGLDTRAQVAALVAELGLHRGNGTHSASESTY